MHALAPYIAAGVAGTLALLVLRWSARQRTLPLPPGPQPRPLIGNLLDIPKEKDWLTYRAWHARYGDVVFVDVLGTKMLVLGSARAVGDLLEGRGAIYSDRPSTPMADLMRFDWAITSLPYGDAWRQKRKLMYAHAHAGVAPRYHPAQLAAARVFARDVLAAGPGADALPRAIRWSLGQTIIKLAYGIDVESEESELITLPGKISNAFGLALTPGRFMVDFLPFLKYVPAWFPGAGFQRFALENHANQRRALDGPIEIVEAQMANGTAPFSMARAMLEEDAELPPAQSQIGAIKDVTGVAYLAGGDTTMSSLLAFFLAMLVYPEVQTNAQAEIDRVVGKDRLPEFDDQENLPYVQAVVSECLRWLPVTPTAVPHLVSQDDEYRGYFIPKGTIVIASAWSILHNPDDYPEPDQFKPERYLTPEGMLDPSVRDPRTACYGFGRRVCLGRFIADSTLFASIATLLATVDIVRAKDADGAEIVPEIEVTSGIVSHPVPFPWSVRSRGVEARALLESSTVVKS